MLQAMRLASKIDSSTCTRAFATLEDSTPLHFAAERGDVALVEILVTHRAEAGARNRQGRTALDIANNFFGGSPPLLLRAALTPDKVALAGLPSLLESTEHKESVSAQGNKTHSPTTQTMSQEVDTQTSMNKSDPLAVLVASGIHRAPRSQGCG